MTEPKVYARPDGWHYHTDRNCSMLAGEEYARLGYVEITQKEAKKRKLRPHTCTDKKRGFIRYGGRAVTPEETEEAMSGIKEAAAKMKDEEGEEVMECSCVAVVSDKGWREKLWVEAFGKPEAPIIPYKTPTCHLPSGVSVCRLLDLSRVRTESLQKLATGIAERFHLSVEQVLDDMHTVGTPIEIDDTVSVRHCPLHQVILESEL